MSRKPERKPVQRESSEQAKPRSKLLTLARAIDETMSEHRALMDGPRLRYDPSILDKLMSQHAEIARSSPSTAVDALVMVTTAQAFASAIVKCDFDELGHDAIRGGVNELLHSLKGVRDFLEKEGGVTATAIGLNPHGTRWQ
jgi:hypothetical protein